MTTAAGGKHSRENPTPRPIQPAPRAPAVQQRPKRRLCDGNEKVAVRFRFGSDSQAVGTAVACHMFTLSARAGGVVPEWKMGLPHAWLQGDSPCYTCGMTRDSALRALPKVELHRHLDGSVRVETIWEIATEAGLDIGARTLKDLRQMAVIREPVRDLAEALARFETQRKVLRSFEAISRVTRENIEDAFHDGVRLLELRFAPAFIAEGRDLSNDEIIGGVLDGLLAGMKAFPVEVGLICILPRGFPVSVNERALNDTLRWKGGGSPGADRICGLDLAAAEAGIDPVPYVRLVNQAREAGLGITIHSGEDTDAAHVARTLDLFRPSRIGHGIKAWGSSQVMARLAAEDVLLEVCLTSNWLTSAVPTLAEHPLPGLYKAGVPVSINSDDPNLMGIDLVNEYEACALHYGFQEKDFQTINRAAWQHSFLPKNVRERIALT